MSSSPPDSLLVAAGRLKRQRRMALIGLFFFALGGVFAWTRFTRPDNRLARGREAVQSTDWELAESYATRLESAGHRNHAHLLRGEAWLARGRPDRALSEFNQIEDSGEIRLQAAAKSGRCLLELGNLPEASRVLEFVVREQPDNVEAHRGLAAIAYDLGQTVIAVEHLEAVARLDPADFRPHRLIGLIYKDSAQNELGVAAYREAIARGLSPKVRDEVQVELAELLIRLARYSEGLELLDSESGGLASPARVLARAECLRGLGRSREAAEILDRASVSGAELSRLRGQLFLEEAKSEDAIRHLERAAAESPADYQTQFLLAQAYSAAGRTTGAEKASARAEELRKDLDQMVQLSREANQKPWDSIVRLQLAEIADRLGKPKLAEVWRAAAASCRSRGR